jgi:hypothetical protein
MTTISWPLISNEDGTFWICKSSKELNTTILAEIEDIETTDINHSLTRVTAPSRSQHPRDMCHNVTKNKGCWQSGYPNIDIVQNRKLWSYCRLNNIIKLSIQAAALVYIINFTGLRIFIKWKIVIKYIYICILKIMSNSTLKFYYIMYLKVTVAITL